MVLCSAPGRYSLLALTLTAIFMVHFVVPLQTARASEISYVGSAHSDPQAQLSKVAILPDAALPGDTVVVIFTRSSSVAWTGPSGVTDLSMVDSFDTGGLTSTVYRSTVADGDPGSSVRFNTVGYAKALLTLAVYRGVDLDDRFETSHTFDSLTTTTHTTAGAPALDGSILVSYWVDRSQTTGDWQASSGNSPRDVAIGTGSGRYSGLLADRTVRSSGLSEPSTGVSTPASKSLMWTIVLAPVNGSNPTNSPPTASFTSSCSYLECTFDGSSSTDLEGPVTSFAWDFGDGESETGSASTHGYATPGTFAVSLTVTDSNQVEETETHRISVAGGEQAEITFLGANHSSPASQRLKSVGLPTLSRVGDTGLMVFTRATSIAWTGPSGLSGWTVVATTTANGLDTTVYTKILTAEDLSQSVTFSAPKYAKSMITVAAYAGVSERITATSSGDRGTAEHLTQSTDTSAGDWVVSYWVDHRETTTSWTTTSATARDNAIGTGSGRYSSLLADSAASVSGEYGGQLGKTNDSTDAVMWSIRLAPRETQPPATSDVTKLLVVVEENRTTAAYDSMPYLKGLADTYGKATNYSGVVHPSNGNYIAMVSGQGADTCGLHNPLPALCPQPGPTIFGRALAVGLSAKTYAESMTMKCQGQNTALYAARHNPWVYFQEEASGCAAHNLPVGTLTSGPFLTDIASGTLPNAGMLIPNLQNDAHDGTVQQADAWLQGWIPTIVSGPDFQSGKLAIVITFDEGIGANQNVPFVVVQRSLSEKTVAAPFTHYGLTRLFTDVLKVAPLGGGSSETGLMSAFGL